jgi:anti-sigma B factor antagonist
MESAPQLTARIDSRNGVVRVAMTGELDSATVPMLTEHLATIERDGASALILDLRDVTFIDSSGLHAFLQASKRAKTNGHRMILTGANLYMRRLFALTGTEYLLDEQEAVSILGQFTGRRDGRTARAPSMEAALDV